MITYSSKKGAGPDIIIHSPNKSRPKNINKPYFIPFLSSLTKFKPIDVIVYDIVSMENTRPICVTFKFLLCKMMAKIGSLYVRHMSESDTLIAIVQIFYKDCIKI